MKRITRFISMALLLAITTAGLFGCYGNMSLTNKLYDWNGSISDKYMQQIAFWVMNIVPVYSAAHFVDVVFLNTIQFWTGSNPMAMKPGEQQIRYTRSGDKILQLKSTQNNLIITETAGPEVGASVQVSYDPQTASWYLTSDGQSQKIATLNGSQLNLIHPDGQQVAVNLVK